MMLLLAFYFGGVVCWFINYYRIMLTYNSSNDDDTMTLHVLIFMNGVAESVCWPYFAATLRKVEEE